jgi:uncharacterized protein YjbJ (UPF0337 family)
MDWDRMSANWAHWRGRVQERWSRLTDAELVAVARAVSSIHQEVLQ